MPGIFVLDVNTQKNPSHSCFGTQKTSINDGKGTSNITSRHVPKVCVRTTNIQEAKKNRKSVQEATRKIQISIMLISNNKTIPFNYYLLARSE